MALLRITGGRWRSRRIRVADAPGLRPTPDRVRETLFNWLGQDLSGLTCLDLFAGSGILGFEAASRGAAQVTFVEQSAAVFAALRENAGTLGIWDTGDHQFLRVDALKFAASFSSAGAAGTKYDVLFLDPPYRSDGLKTLEPHLPHLARPGMRIYAEAPQPLESLGEWRTVKRGQAGQVHFHLLEKP